MNMPNESWPLRRSDALFVVAVVMLALAVVPQHSGDWGVGIPPMAVLLLVGCAIVAWIYFRVYGGRNQRNTRF
jgi:hypothetical protein